MPKSAQRLPASSRNTGKPWKETEERALKDLAAGNTPTRVIGVKLQRSESSVRSKAKAMGVSLKPANRSPYA